MLTNMKIWIMAYEFPPFPGGQGTYAYEMAQEFHRRGWDVIVIAPKYADLKSGSFPYPVYRIFQHQSLRFIKLWELNGILRNVSPDDIVLSCDIRAGLMLRFVWQLQCKRIIQMFHGGEVLNSKRGMVFRIANSISASRAKSLVANSSYSASLVCKYLNRKCTPIPLGVSDYWHEVDSSDFESDVLRTINKSTKVICLAARLERRKGHLQAMTSLLSIADKVEGFKFVFVGRIEDKDYAEEVFALQRKHPEIFLYAGAVSRSDVRRLYKRSRFLLLLAQPEPHHIEGFGLVIVEAAAQGCPALSTSVGGIPDAIINGKTGILVQHDDVKSINDRIIEMVSDDALVEELSANCLDFSRKMTWTHVVDATLDTI